MENLEDGVALFSPRGDVIFSNAAMRALRLANLSESHPVRQLVDRTLATRSRPAQLSTALPLSDGAIEAQVGTVHCRRLGQPSKPIPTPSVAVCCASKTRLLLGHARGLQRRLSQSRALDAQLFAQGGGDRAAARRRGPRSEEPLKR